VSFPGSRGLNLRRCSGMLTQARVQYENYIPKIKISNLSKSYTQKDKKLEVLNNVDLVVQEGEFLTIVGSSGCGKSTLLRLIAGLDRSFNGSITINDQIIAGIGRDRGMVFQDHRLFPWMNVEQNIGFGLEHLPTKQRNLLVQEHIDLVGLRGFEKAKPRELSGGMSQRVAIARTLVKKPDIILFDEPFGALDALTRIQMQHEILKIREQSKTTMILVTHDIDEAVILGDRVIVMSKKPGRIQKTIPVHLPRPRDRNSYDFLKIREQIFYLFFDNEIGKIPEDYSI
jgi:sulfonate transport system ATP-binding protein